MNFSQYYTESILDRSRVSLDPTVFQTDELGTSRLNPAIKAQIFEDIISFKRSIQINKLLIIGSILTKNYSKDSDIDVTLEVNKEDVDQETGVLGVEAIIQLLRSLNGKLAVGTTHPINYYITTEFKEENADAIYDIDTDQWVKEPQDTSANLSDYIEKFESMVANVDLSTGKLRRDVIDYNELKDLDEDSIVNFHTILNKKLYEINKTVEDLVKFKKDVGKKRLDSFSKPMTPEQIVKYATKNKLPANVVYKLFQKYYYFDLINRLDDVISDRDKSNEYMDDLEGLLGYKESFTFEEFHEVCEGFKKLKTSGVDWKTPNASRKYKDKRFKMSKSMTGKSLRQVPSIFSRSHGQSHRTLNLANKAVDVAKKAPSGIWRLTPMQVKEIALKYHHFPPNNVDPIKHLGNTGIVVWKKSPTHYYLVKHHAFGRK